MRAKWFSLLLCTLPVAACGNAGTSSTDDDPATVDQLVSSSFGGVTEANALPVAEDPDFADATLTEDDLTVPASASDPATTGRGVRVAIMWGYLRPHRDATEFVDWGGTICATGAGIRVLRTLKFEAATDMVIRPRTSPSCVEFTSRTRPASDGLLLDLVVPATADPTTTPGISLTFTSAPITDTLVIAPGMQGSKIVKVDDAGHVLAYHLVRPSAGTCHTGFTRGHWIALGQVGQHDVGVLRGRWTSSDGDLKGFVKGIFGVRHDGSKLFFAKVADHDGALIGLLAGRYADGEFGGLVLGRGKVVLGGVHGQYEAGPAGEAGGFIGRWSVGCGNAPGEGMPAGGDEPAVAPGDAMSAGN